MESDPNKSSSVVPWLVGGIVTILVCCACAIIVAAGAIIYQSYQQAPLENVPPVSPTIEFLTPESAPTVELPTTVPVPTLDRSASVPAETLETLNQTLVPENDPYELACRLKNICNVSRIVPDKNYKVGDLLEFKMDYMGTLRILNSKCAIVFLS